MKRITLLHLITITFLGLSANTYIFVKAQDSSEDGKGSLLNSYNVSASLKAAHIIQILFFAPLDYNKKKYFLA